MESLEKEFFKFIYKRQLIWYKRFFLRQNPPWTNDKVLETYKIINVYRELDRCTIYLLNKLRDVHNRDALFINIVFYRFFNQSGLYEKLGIQPFNYISSSLKKKLTSSFESIKDRGLPIFNNAYLISSGVQGKKKHLSILDNLENLDIRSIVNEIDGCKTPEESLEIIQKIQMVGPFLACEIWTDLSYFKFFKQGWTDNDFVNIGPGAKWGLEIMYGEELSKKELKEKLYHLHQVQKEYLKGIHEELEERLPWDKIAFKDAFSNYPYLSITNIEGSLCEFRKYWNISNGKGRRKYFKPST